MLKLVFYLETKRKRHDLTPISKSHASSHLFKKKGIRKGTLLFCNKSVNVNIYLIEHLQKRPQEEKERRGQTKDLKGLGRWSLPV